MKATLTASLNWYPLSPHVGQKGFRRCMIRNGSANTITISQRGGSSPPAVPNQTQDNMGFPILSGTQLIVSTQEMLWAATVNAGDEVHYEYLQ